MGVHTTGGLCYVSVASVHTAVHRMVVLEAVSLVCKLFGALALAVNAAPVFFPVGDAGQHVEVWSSGWTGASSYETACLIRSGVDEFAIRGTEPEWAEIVNHGDDIGARAPV